MRRSTILLISILAALALLLGGYARERWPIEQHPFGADPDLRHS